MRQEWRAKRALMSGGSGRSPARQDPDAAPAQPGPPAPLPYRPPARPCLARQAAAREEADLDLDAYITQMVAHAPPLSTQQRDKLALILHDELQRHGDL